MQSISLCELKHGQRAIVTAVNVCGSLRRRLQDIGLVPNAKVECINSGLFGDPVAYLIRGAVIALRKEDSSAVSVLPIQ